jgi:hypothetical protein
MATRAKFWFLICRARERHKSEAAEELIIAFAATGYVALFEIEDAKTAPCCRCGTNAKTITISHEQGTAHNSGSSRVDDIR